MRPFNFESSKDEKAALSLHHQSTNSRYLAGGTTLVDLMKLEVEKPDLVIDLTTLPLKEIHESSRSLHVGALVTNSKLAFHPTVREKLPVLSQAILSGASPQLRNLATTGGNLLQKTRCPYFRDTSWPCNKREPGSGCSALEGFNRSHAVLGTSSHCIATSPSDMNVALAALDAQIHVRGDAGERVIPIGDFFCLPKETPHIETSLRDHELITAVEIPISPLMKNSHYVKVRDRASYEFALASAAVALEIRSGKIRDARVALGGLGTIPWRSPQAEERLKGQPANLNTYKAAAEVALSTAAPKSYNAFKVQLGKLTLIRALTELERKS